MMKSSSVERDEFSVVAWRLTAIQHSGWGWEDHSTSQERWTRMFWRVILSLSVMAPRGVAHSQISDFWKGCRFVIVSLSRRVLSLWLFYMQASVSWTWCELQLVASASRQREVWCALLGSLKTSRAAAFWINYILHICTSIILKASNIYYKHYIYG